MCCRHVPRDGKFALSVTQFDWGSARYRKTGALMFDNGVETLKAYDAVLFGAVGAPDVPDQVTPAGVNASALSRPVEASR